MTAVEPEAISPATLHEWTSAGKKFHLIHTLPGDHYQCAHLPGAANACVYEVAFMDQVYAITRDIAVPVVVYGDSAGTMAATVAAEKLQRAGFTSVHILEGGLEAWRTQGLPLEGSDTALPLDSGVPPPVRNGSYTLDLGSSIIEWTGRNPNTRHFGTLNLSAGSLAVTDGDISGTFEIDMNTIESLSLQGDELQPVLEAHLKSDDFFFVKLFPRSRFTLETARPVENATYTLPNYQIGGDLELRGITAPLDFAANLFQLEDDSLVADAHFDFDRTRWGIIYGSSRFFKHLGMHVIYDLFSVQLKLRFTPE